MYGNDSCSSDNSSLNSDLTRDSDMILVSLFSSPASRTLEPMTTYVDISIYHFSNKVVNFGFMFITKEKVKEFHKGLMIWYY